MSDNLPISIVGSVTSAIGSTSVAPAYPTGNANGDIVFLEVVTKMDTATIVTPSGWTLVSSATGGSGALGIGTGTLRFHLFYKLLTGNLTGTQAVTITGGDSSIGTMICFRYTTPSGYSNTAWVIPTALSMWSRTTAATAFGGTGGTVLAFQREDIARIIVASPDDQPTVVTIQNITVTGVSFDIIVSGTLVSNTTGNDTDMQTGYRRVKYGLGTSTPVVQATSNSSETGIGLVYLVRATGIAPTVYGYGFPI